ncbi:hypothetical protein [Azospirillum sp.]|uniref:hypothetical protein n=1 Tax=Azospirillum sp. TaxID=34012 RepID=UPI003D717FDA
MAKRQANAAGVVTGSFQIPANVPGGSKKVEFFGAGGSYGSATFVGSNKITNETRRRVLTIERNWHDPLAQTFALSTGRHIGGVELWFTAKGGSAPVLVQIRNVVNGVPNGDILAQGIIKASDILLGGVPTRVTFPPLWVEANTEYAIVVLTDDADHALAVAELGKFDQVSGWITEQPYQIGVLLSSSNASTWTPHNDRDLTFRLLGARFNTLTATVPLGTISATDASDLIAVASVEQPAADCNVDFLFTLPDNSQVRVASGQVASLPAKVNGNVSVAAVLKGSALRSPVLFPGVQPILGTLKDTGTYVSRAIPAGTGVKITVTLETFTPGTSTVQVQALAADGTTWTNITLASATPAGNGWEERTYVLTGFTATTTRIKLTLSGTAIYRPRARKLRAYIT